MAASSPGRSHATIPRAISSMRRAGEGSPAFTPLPARLPTDCATFVSDATFFADKETFKLNIFSPILIPFSVARCRPLWVEPTQLYHTGSPRGAALHKPSQPFCFWWWEAFVAGRKEKACAGWGRCAIICGVLRSLPHGVTVAQLTLDQFVKVRILVRQPIWMDCGGSRNPFFDGGRGGRESA